MSSQLSEILTIDEVAAPFKAGKFSVYRLAANRRLLALKLGALIMAIWINGSPVASAMRWWMMIRGQNDA
jgi:hypothetical protein